MAAIHIAFGESAAGILKAALKLYAQQFWQNGEDYLEFSLGATVLTCTDEFAIGPVYEMDLPSGFYARLSWLGRFYEETFEPEKTLDDVDDALERISDFYKKLAWIEGDRQVVLWHGENVVDQMGIRILSSLLPECHLYHVPLEESLKQLSFKDGQWDLEAVVHKIACIEKVEHSTQKKWANEWEKLIQSRGTLRVFLEDKIVTVPSDYYDKLLVDYTTSSARPALELIDEVLEEYVCEAGKAYLGHRIRRLVESGRLIAKGPLTHYRDFIIWKLELNA